MANEVKVHRPVKQLPAEVARKIAAGEVIDRPNAIVRELLDNAVDSGADRINVEIEGGGIDKIRISDNGSGMSKEDLLSCARPHATSKIADAEDLMKLTTLGFRGEALASIAAVARLSIASGSWRMRASITEDHIIEEIPEIQNGKGTIVMSEGLFENFPARRIFLKRAASETMLCRETFVEKALARTDIAFRLTLDGKIRYDLPSGVSRAERLVSALEIKEDPKLFYELKCKSPSENGMIPWSFHLVIGEPSIWRNDRKQLFIYVNGRKVQEYSLLQAIEYGCQGFFPNGTHPVAALFVEMDPSLVDFNIHPAKKEVRFKDCSALHHGVSSTVRDFFRGYGIHQSRQEIDLQKSFADFEEKEDKNEESQKISSLALSALSEEEEIPPPQIQKEQRVSQPTLTDAEDFRSRFFNYERTPSKEKTFDFSKHEKPTDVFTSSQDSNSSFADDKTISERITSDENPVSPGENTTSTDEDFSSPSVHAYDAPLSPLEGFLTGSNAPDVLEKDKDGFRYLGTVLGTFLIAEVGDTLYFIDQHAAHERILFNKIISSGGEKQPLLVPYVLETNSKGDDDYLKSIQTVLEGAGFTLQQTENGNWECTTTPVRWTGTEGDLKEALFEKRTNPQEIIYSIAAMTACKAAVKDGYILDRTTAAALAKAALALSDPHCPHGRPVWTTLTKEQLFARVRRTR